MELKTAVNFKQKCENSDSFLRNIHLPVFDKVVFDDDFIDTNLFDVPDYLNENDLKPDFEELFDNGFELAKLTEKANLVDNACQVDSPPLQTATLSTSPIVKKKPSSRKFTLKCRMCEEEFTGPTKLIAHAMDQHQDTKPFKCPFEDCPKTYQNPKALKVHKRSRHEKEKRFKCDECSMQFYVKANFESHQRIHTGEKFECKECEKSFSSLSYLRQHHKLTHDENALKQIFTCPIPNCNRTFHTSNLLKSHSNTHSERKIPCDYCESSFKSRQSLKVHLLKHSVGKAKSLQCHVCGWVSIYRQQYYEHIKAHSAKRNLECFHCGKKFTKKSLIILHLQTHLSQRNFKCNVDDCQKAFKTYNSYYAHKRKHQSKSSAKYNCASCDKVFSSQSVLQSHVKSHTGESFTCHYEGCTKAYTHKQNLNMHLLTAHIQSNITFKCEICDRILSNSNALRVHLAKVHKAEKNINCDECDMNFASAQLLTVHKKQIHKLKAFNCKFCNYSANYQIDLNKHVERTHLNTENDK